MPRDPSFADTLGDFTADSRVVMLAAMAALVGVISAFVALALVRLIGLFTNLAYFHRFDTSFASPAGNTLGLWAVGVPVVGGLIVGLMARYGSEKIRGHGIPEAMEAILIGQSRIDSKIAVLKPLSTAIAIGTGGPFGAEGPIIATGGAFGSLFAQAFHLSTAERKTLLVAGSAGGMAAIFATPVAAVLLAVELLLFEWKPRSFIPVASAAAVAAALRVPLMGAGPVFATRAHLALSPPALLIALGSGTSGGVLAPLMIMGGALGALIGPWLPGGDPGVWAALGMGAMLGGTMRAPFTAIAFMLEVTHDVNLLPAMLVACVAADAVTVLLMKRSILTEKMARRGYHVMREYIVNPLHLLRVSEVMEKDVPTVPASLPVDGLFERLADEDPVIARRQEWPVVDDDERLVGLVTRGDLVRALEREDGENTTVRDLGSRRLIVTHGDELLEEATAKMIAHDIGRLPVVDRDDPSRLVGLLGRAGVMAVWLHASREEHERDGWLTGRLKQLRSRFGRRGGGRGNGGE